ncbi:MAG TPA: RHS repeat-associated core domain-containing protein [Dehalococcoidia bacterium]|nr:RHS repeat-associated core domain-containing protein [Dehalococcoidia bacterium]
MVTDSSGAQYGYTRYYPYGSTRDSGGSLDTDKKFTGQRADASGLYYYGARYYLPAMGRFISADTVVPNPYNPQSLNRYSYCLNNPLRYTDPTGHDGAEVAQALMALANNFKGSQYGMVIAAGLLAIAWSITVQDNMGSGNVIVDTLNDVSNAASGVIDWFGEKLFPPSSLSPGWAWDTTNMGHSTPEMVYVGIKGVTIGDALNVNVSLAESKEPSTTAGRAIRDAKEHPDNWEREGDPQVEDATGSNYKGGQSVRETIRSKVTGETLEHHTIYDRNGRIVHEHWAIK